MQAQLKFKSSAFGKPRAPQEKSGTYQNVTTGRFVVTSPVQVTAPKVFAHVSRPIVLIESEMSVPFTLARDFPEIQEMITLGPRDLEFVALTEMADDAKTGNWMGKEASLDFLNKLIDADSEL